MSKLSVKKGDTVLVIAGKDSGKVAKVNAVEPKEQKVVVAGVNIVSKHTKARTAQEKSQIVKREAPISASNVLVVCPKCNKATRVAHAVVDGEKHRVCKKCGASLDSKYVKPKKADKKAKVEEPKVEKVAEEKPKKSAAKKATKTSTTKKTTGAKKTASKKAE